jgi:hypothetical protein
MKNKNSETRRGNRVSRFGFLRLLGAEAIICFAYRIGFTNSLFGCIMYGAGIRLALSPSQVSLLISLCSCGTVFVVGSGALAFRKSILSQIPVLVRWAKIYYCQKGIALPPWLVN